MKDNILKLTDNLGNTKEYEILMTLRNNKKYANKIDAKAKGKLNTLSKFIDKKKIQSNMTSKQMAAFFGMDVNKVKDLYTYYISLNNVIKIILFILIIQVI